MVSLKHHGVKAEQELQKIRICIPNTNKMYIDIDAKGFFKLFHSGSCSLFRVITV